MGIFFTLMTKMIYKQLYFHAFFKNVCVGGLATHFHCHYQADMVLTQK